MKCLHSALAAIILIATISPICVAHSQNGASATVQGAPDLSGLRDFDFLVGDWRVHHRVMSAGGAQKWQEFEGTASNRALMDGWVNVEDHRFDKPTGVSRGVALRAYDPQTAQWAIWWVDGRVPHGPMDPPVKGRFENGVGTFYSDYVQDGKPMRVRYIWSRITSKSAQWEQASSSDAGKTWETNWIMEFRRSPSGEGQVQQGVNMTDKNDSAPLQVLPQPDPALKRLDRLVGAWSMKGHQLAAKFFEIPEVKSFMY